MANQQSRGSSVARSVAEGAGQAVTHEIIQALREKPIRQAIKGGALGLAGWGARKTAEQLSAERQRFRSYRESEWPKFDAPDFKGVDVESLETAVDMTDKEEWQDRMSRIKGWFGLSTLPTHREQKFASLNHHVVEGALTLGQIPDGEMADLAIGLIERTGGLNHDDAMEVLVAYLVEKDEADNAGRMISQLQRSNQSYYDSLAKATVEAGRDYTKYQETDKKMRDFDSQLHAHTILRDQMDSSLKRYERADREFGSVRGVLKGVGHAAARGANVVAKMFGKEVKLDTPKMILEDEQKVMEANLQAAYEQMDGTTEMRYVAKITQTINDANRLRTFIDNGSFQPDMDSEDTIETLVQFLEYDIGQLENMQERYGELFIAATHGDIDPQLQPIVNDFHAIHNQINTINRIIESYELRGDQTLTTDEINSVRAVYVDHLAPDGVSRKQITTLEERAQYKKDHFATARQPIHTMLVALRDFSAAQQSPQLNGEPIPAAELRKMYKEIATARRALENEKAQYPIPAEYGNIIHLQQQIRENTGRIRYFQEKVETAEDPDSRLNFYGGLLAHLTENDNILVEIGEKRFMARELRYAREENLRRSAIAQLPGSESLGTEQREAIHGTLERLTEEFGELGIPNEGVGNAELLDEWINGSFAELGSFGFQLPQGMEMDHVREAVRGANVEKMSFMQLLFVIFGSMLSANNSPRPARSVQTQ